MFISLEPIGDNKFGVQLKISSLNYSIKFRFKRDGVFRDWLELATK